MDITISLNPDAIQVPTIERILIKNSEGIDDMLPWSDFMQKSCPKVEQKTTEVKPVGME